MFDSLCDRRGARRVIRRLESAAQVFGEKLFDFRVKVKFGFGQPLAMTFVPVNYIFDGLIRLAHGRHHLLAFGRDHSGVVDPVSDQQRRFDLIDVKQR